MRISNIILTLLFLFTAATLHAQNQYGNEEEMIKAADEMFEQGNYKEAMPLFSQLVSLYPKEGIYNMKYGACLLFNDEDKSKCLKFLKFAASKSESGPEAHYYYGLAMHRNYNFSKAIKQYKKFLTDGNKKQIEEWQVARKIEMCNNGMSLLTNVFDLNVIEKKDIGKSEFFRIYDLGEIGGKIIVKPDEFKSKADIKSGESFLIHLPDEANVIYFSGYGDGKGGDKDIFRVRKKADNTWSEPENIGNVVNTPFDEDFPFMHPDGTLYFSSKGHNSMGGYDLFKSEYNESTGTWSKPENLNFAISSAFDDLLFITDYKKQLAYFASNRSTSLDKLNVYRVVIKRKPFDKAFLSGTFIAEGDADAKTAKITIYDLESEQKIGSYFTNKETGKYNISLPKGGKTYKFVVETDDESPVHTGKVEVPVQEGMASLKQEIRLVGSGDEQKLLIKNMFNESAPLSEAALAQVLRESSSLEVNATEEEVMQTLSDEPLDEVPQESTAKEGDVNTQHAALVAEMENEVQNLQKDLIDLKDQIAFGFKYSFERAVRAEQLYDQVEVNRQNMANENDPDKKKEEVEKLMAQKEKLNPVASDAIVSYDFTKSLANEFDEKLNDIDRLKSDAQNLKSNAKGADEDKKADLEKYGPMLTDMQSMRSAMEIAPQRYEDLLAKAKEKLNRQKVFYEDTKSDIEAVEAEIKRIEEEISTSNNKKKTSQLQEEKGTKEIDLQDLQYEFKDLQKNYRNQKKEVENLEIDKQQINAFLDKMKANTTSIPSLKAEDQAELNKIIEFLKEQRMLDDMIGEEMESFISSSGSSEDLSRAQSYNAIDNQGQEVAYDELYNVNLASIELILEDKRRYKEMSVLYENWANTLKEDREIKMNELNYTENKADKEVLEERIRILEEKERAYREMSVEYVEKMKEAELALSESEKVQEEDSNATADAKNQDEKNEAKPSDDGAMAAGGVVGVESMLNTTVYQTGPVGGNMEDLNKSYEKAKEDIPYGSEEAADEIEVAAFELQWAKSIDDIIEEKKVQLNDPAYSTDWAKINELIDEYEAEKQKHLALASSEFTAMEIDRQMGEEAASLDEKYYIPFDPQNLDKEAYNAEYEALAAAVENHQILSREEKDRELSMIHNYWSRTIQDDIIWHEKEKTKLKSQAELNELNNEILDLNVDKEKHINLSNEFYQKYKASNQYQTDLDEKESRLKSLSAGAGQYDAKTYDEYSDVYLTAQMAKEEKLQKMQSDLDAVGSKGEKQQIELAMALLERQKEDEKIAQEELEAKGGAELINEEASASLEENAGSWQEEAEDYVFTKKDFNTDVPQSSLAYEQYNLAEEAYSKVQLLESQKAGLLNTTSFIKGSDQEMLSIQEEIEKEKLIAYQALARAGKEQFSANKKEIDRLMELNPDLEKTNPKLMRDIKASEVIYAEVEKYQKNAEGFKSNQLKFDIYDQAQFMSEYVLAEQKSIISALKGATYTGELSFMAMTDGDREMIDAEVEDFKISKQEADRIMTDPIFLEYEEDRKALLEIQKERLELEAEVQNQESALKTLVDQRNLVVQEAYGTKGGKRKKLLKEADVLNVEIETQQKSLDSVTLAMVQLKEQENNLNNNSLRLLKQASVDDRYKMVMLAEMRVRGEDESTYLSDEVASFESTETEEGKEDSAESLSPPEETQSTTTSVSPQVTTLGNNEFTTLGTEIPENLEGDLFITAASATVTPYNENKPIPIDAEIPTGLIFKVQVGAYRNPIPQDLFKGFAPLMGEKLDNGITRYTAGLFRDFGNANQAKNEIRKLGYSDAFVVAFYNGKRISFQELRNIEDIDMSLPPPVADNTFNGVPEEVLTTPSIIDDPGEVSSAIAEQTTNTKEVKGLFFTVQVGVYTNTLVPERLKVLRNLNSELLPNGNVRYSVGQFASVDEARERRADVIGTVADAFVTAYNNGVRISVGEAIRLQGEVGQ